MNEKIKDKSDGDEVMNVKVPVGIRLKKEREDKGISLETIHDSIKVPLDVLRAIEEGYTIRTLSPFYYNGFVKMYGQYLKVDVSDVLTSQPKVIPGQTLEQEYKQFFLVDLLTRIITTRRIEQFLTIIFGLLLLFGLFKTIQAVFNRPNKESIKAVKIVEPVLKERSVKGAKPTVRVVAKPKPVPKSVVKSKPIVPQKPVQVRPKSIKSNTVVLPVKARIFKNVTLVVRARKDSWLRVRQDGNVVFESTLKMGAVETWLADKNIEISGKNITQLEFELNGKMIGTLGRKDRKAKSLVFTEDGLEIRK